jgi:comEA protein
MILFFFFLGSYFGIILDCLRAGGKKMIKLKKLVTLFVVLSVVVVFASSAYAAEKSGAKASTDKKLININTAGVEELIKLPRVGPKISQRIIDYREKNGKFKKLEDLMKVSGIGEKTFKGFEDMIKL